MNNQNRLRSLGLAAPFVTVAIMSLYSPTAEYNNVSPRSSQSIITKCTVGSQFTNLIRSATLFVSEAIPADSSTRAVCVFIRLVEFRSNRTALSEVVRPTSFLKTIPSCDFLRGKIRTIGRVASRYRIPGYSGRRSHEAHVSTAGARAKVATPGGFYLDTADVVYIRWLQGCNKLARGDLCPKKKRFHCIDSLKLYLHPLQSRDITLFSRGNDPATL